MTKSTRRRVTWAKADGKYTLTVGDERLEDISEQEAMTLLHQMLVVTPDVSLNDRHEILKLRQPRLVTVVYYKAVEGAVVEARRREEIRVMERHEVTREIHDQVSMTKAENDALIQQAEAYCREAGITMKDLMAELKTFKAETNIVQPLQEHERIVP